MREGGGRRDGGWRGKGWRGGSNVGKNLISNNRDKVQRKRKKENGVKKQCRVNRKGRENSVKRRERARGNLNRPNRRVAVVLVACGQRATAKSTRGNSGSTRQREKRRGRIHTCVNLNLEI